MGVTGAGKSTFIANVTQRDDIVVGHSLTSETSECKTYPFRHGGMSFSLIDTPGFDDTYRDDAQVLGLLASFMAATYRHGATLSAIIYLHPITNERFEGSARDNLLMFQKLCGADFYPNVVLATSFWSLVDEATGARREAELRDRDEFWGEMVRQGSSVVRLPDDRDACVNLLVWLSASRRAPLQIQKELVDDGRELRETQAGLSTEALRELLAMETELRQQTAAARQAVADERRRQEEKAAAARQWEIEFEEQMQRKREADAREREDHVLALRLQFEERQRETQAERDRIVAEIAEQERSTREQIARQRQQQIRDSRRILEIQIRDIIAIRTQFDLTRNLSVDCETLRIPICDICQHSCSVKLSYGRWIPQFSFGSQ
jgi:hypothetical protein